MIDYPKFTVMALSVRISALESLREAVLERPVLSEYGFADLARAAFDHAGLSRDKLAADLGLGASAVRKWGGPCGATCTNAARRLRAERWIVAALADEAAGLKADLAALTFPWTSGRPRGEARVH